METKSSADSEKPYSPSSPLNESDDENKMDWESNLSGNGIKRLFKQPPNPTGEEARKADAEKVDPELLIQRQGAAKEKEPPKEAVTDETAGEANCNKSDSNAGAGTSSSSGGGGGNGDGVGDGAGGSKKTPLALKVSNFLERAKDKTVTEIKTRMGRDMLIYDAISASNSKATAAMNILGTKTADPVRCAGFLDLGDGRIMSGGLQLDMTNKRIVSTSFNSEWKCLRCPQHTSGPALKMRGAADSSCSKQVIVIADQSFPAVLPVSGQDGCLKIILVENGSLDSLLAELVKQVGNRRVPPGSAILAFSAAHLANVGVEQYARDLVAMENKIREKYGNETVFQPLPPVLLGGTDNTNLIRSIFELSMWVEFYYEGDNSLERTNILSRAMLMELGKDEVSNIEMRRYSLPANNSKQATRVWASGGQDSRAMPCTISALTHSMEAKYVNALVGEIRAKMALDLDPQPIVDRALGEQTRPRRKVDVLVVGAANAPLLAAALRTKGKTCDVLTSKTWSISRASAEHVAGQVQTVIQTEDPDLIVMQLMDTSSFYVRKEDGSRHLPRPGPDGSLHLEGEVVVCTRDIQQEHLRSLRPMFEAVGRKKCVWVAPMMRYVVASCCEDPSHAPNRRDRYSIEEMKTQLDSFKRGLKDHIHGLNKKNIKVADPSLDLRGMSPEDIWGTDPVNPTTAALSKIADGVLLMASKLSARQEENQQSAIPRGGGYQRPRPRGGHRGSGRGGQNWRQDLYENREYSDYSDYNSGRWHDPSNAHGGRGHRGGHRDNRARPY
jgi:hypothetical protein